MDAARRTAIHDAMVRLSDGDRAGFSVLLDQLWPVILSFARRGVGQEADAEDIAQEVFFRICSRIADFDRSRDGLSWAFGIAAFEIKTYRRRLQRRREVHGEPQLSGEVDPATSQEQTLLQREIEAAFVQALGVLSDEDRRTLGLLESGPADDASGAARRKRKQRAVERLRSLLEEYLW